MARVTKQTIDSAVKRFCNEFGLKTGFSPGYVDVDFSASRYSLDLILPQGGRQPLVEKYHLPPTEFVRKMDAMVDGAYLLEKLKAERLAKVKA